MSYLGVTCMGPLGPNVLLGCGQCNESLSEDCLTKLLPLLIDLDRESE